MDTNTNRGNHSKLLNYNEILMDHYSTKNSNRYNSNNLGAPGVIYQIN
jgi:hypothetical protein